MKRLISLFVFVSGIALGQPVLSAPAPAPELAFGGASDGGLEAVEYDLVPLTVVADIGGGVTGLAENETIRPLIQPAVRAVGDLRWWIKRRLNFQVQLVVAGNPMPTVGSDQQVASQIRLGGGTFAGEIAGVVGVRINNPEDRGALAIQLRAGVQGALQLADTPVSVDGISTTRFGAFGLARERVQVSLWLYWFYAALEYAAFQSSIATASEFRGAVHRPMWTVNVGVPLQRQSSDGAVSVAYLQVGLSGASFDQIFNSITVSIGSTFATVQ